MKYRSRKYALATGQPHRKVFAAILKALKVKKEDKILEIGAGRGIMLKKITPFCQKAVGIDLNPWSLALKEYPKIKLMSATDLTFPKESFDKIYSANTIEHIMEIDLFFKEAERVLKPGGKMVLVYPLEIFRGITALKDALFVFKNPFKARKLHLNKFGPRAIKRIAEKKGFSYRYSRMARLFLPQYLTVLEKRGMV